MFAVDFFKILAAHENEDDAPFQALTFSSKVAENGVYKL